ncbi:hypothetical protein H6F57_26735 [Leptolyngbya sp. FACHB-60]|nr:hypothetical protein [Phormidium sp. FACHB-77]MBD2054397.1 hypothetical protein [Leptolyngbya sp. FACHB-60]
MQDVIHTVRWTRAQGVGLSVRGGGHDFVGRALSEEWRRDRFVPDESRHH